MAKFCTNCGQEISEGNRACTNCGTLVDGGSPVTTTVNVNNVQNPTNGFAIAGFIISLVSLFCCGTLDWLGLIFSIIGLVKAKSLNGSGKGLAIAGIIISCIGLIILIIFFAIGGLASIFESYSSVPSVRY